MKRLITLLFFFQTFSVFAQSVLKPMWTSYSWEDDRKPYTLSAEEKKKGAVIMLDKRIIEIYFDQVGKESQVNEYYTKHVIVSLNSDNAIEEYNTVYIPMTNVTALVDLHARFISKTGKVVEFKESGVKDVENYNNHGPYKIFAMEGVEKGGEVEYIYTIKRPFRMYGSETYRSSYDYRKISLDIVAPSHLKYDAKSYNGLPDPETDDDADKKNVLHMDADSIPGFEEEQYSSNDAAYPRVEFKLAYNLSQGRRKRLYTWNDAAEGYFRVVTDATDNEKRMCEALYKRMDVDLLSDRTEKIRKIESYLKTHFTVREDASGEKFERITGILQTHLATELGMMRLYWEMFAVADIKREIVLTTDRYDKVFDGDFDTWSFLQHFLMYFPSTDGYIAPSEQFSRYGFPSSNWTGQDGLFIREVELGGVKSGIGTVKHIEASDYKASTLGLYANINFDLEKGLTNMHMKHTYTGYSAAFMQPYFLYMSAEDRRNTVNDILKNEAADAKPQHTRVTGYNSDDTLYYQPFTIEADYSTNSYLEKTCDKYIFKVGEIIGLQTEMYQANKRRTDIEVAYTCNYHRVITFEIPAGYRATNLETLNMDVYHIDDSTKVRSMDFTSSYKVEGRTVTVTVDETYRKTHYPKSLYEEYRKVVNASADFNKVVIYFEKDSN